METIDNNGIVFFIYFFIAYKKYLTRIIAESYENQQNNLLRFSA